MGTTDTSRLYDLGYRAGQEAENRTGPNQLIVFLMWGQPVKFSDGSFGATIYSAPDARTGDIRAAAQAYARGFYYGTVNVQGDLILVLGTSNNGGSVTAAHGDAWGRMVDNMNDYLFTNGYSSEVIAAGGIDAELGFNGPGVTKDWTEGYKTGGDSRYFNFGDAAGCPPAGTCGTAAYPGWTAHDIYYISWGNPLAWPYGQIYRNDGLQADQWRELDVHAVEHDSNSMFFEGSLTQWHACQDVGCEASLANTGEDGWRQLHSSISSKHTTSQTTGPDYASDITWKN
jgi:hypothetical protein